MKVLWLVSTIFPYPAEKINMGKTVFGGWLYSMFSEVSKHDDLSFCVVTTYTGGSLKEFRDNNNVYYLVPDSNPSKYNKSTISHYRKIINNFNPDIIHIHGTEYPRGLELINSCSNIPIVTSIQGLASSVADVYYGNISAFEIIKNITFRDIVKFNTIFDCRRDFYKRSLYEKEIIKKSDYIIGRTLWDKSNVLSISPNVKYFHLDEILRDDFYRDDVWDRKKIIEHSLFCSQSSYPIKGLHILLKAMSILKLKYSDISLYISGMNIIDESSFTAKIKRIGYGKYIKKLIKKYNLKDNVFFIGFLSSSEVVDRLLKTHVFVSPSFIENESNSLSEASILGVPSVGSYVGGVTERIVHNETGFHYPVCDYAMLANYIDRIFSDDELANKFSNNERKMFLEILNREKNGNELYNIYRKIVSK